MIFNKYKVKKFINTIKKDIDFPGLHRVSIRRKKAEVKTYSKVFYLHILKAAKQIEFSISGRFNIGPGMVLGYFLAFPTLLNPVFLNVRDAVARKK